MHRRVEAARHIAPGQRGIEIAPFHDGLLPRRLGYDCLILDVFDTKTLKERAAADPHVDRAHLAHIEDVDLVGSAGAIAALVAERGLLGQLDYVVSSHNFEHLPDPVSFLQGCSQVLKPGGVVSMVLPDRRVSFDHFRPHSTTADLIDAHFERRTRPTPKQVFQHESLHSYFLENGVRQLAFALHRGLQNVEPWQTLEDAWRNWSAQRAAPDETYRDVHCWAFSPASLELVLRDLDWLRLIDFEVLGLTEFKNHEFFVHLRKPVQARAPVPAEAFYARRKELLRETNREAGDCSFARDGQEQQVAQQLAANQQQIAQLEDTVSAARALIAELEAALADRTAQAGDAQRIAALEARLSALEESHSWKVTAPLRVASQMLRRFTLNRGPEVVYEGAQKEPRR